MKNVQPRVAIINYGIGNLHSVHKALQKVGADAFLTSDSHAIAAADAVVLPGVGAFGSCMNALRSSGLDKDVLASIDRGQPLLAICVGMQMLYEGSQESPGVTGLNVVPGQVTLLPESVKRPQMQWNKLEASAGSSLEQHAGEWMYFVHSYAGEQNEYVTATVDYGGPVVAALEKGSLVATQFHPEKSSQAGLSFLKSFVANVGQNMTRINA